MKRNVLRRRRCARTIPYCQFISFSIACSRMRQFQRFLHKILNRSNAISWYLLWKKNSLTCKTNHTSPNPNSKITINRTFVVDLVLNCQKISVFWVTCLNSLFHLIDNWKYTGRQTWQFISVKVNIKIQNSQIIPYFRKKHEDGNWSEIWDQFSSVLSVWKFDQFFLRRYDALFFEPFWPFSEFFSKISSYTRDVKNFGATFL